MLETIFTTMLLGGAVVLALWTDLRFGEAGPARVVTVVLHLAAATLAVVLSTEAMAAVDGSRPLAVLSVMVVFLPALVYLFVSALWALKIIQRSIAHQ